MKRLCCDKNQIINYVLSIGLTEKDAQYYIDNGYTLEQTIESIEEINDKLMEDTFEI